MDRLPVALFAVDRDGRVRLANERARNLLDSNNALQLNKGRLLSKHSHDSRELSSRIQRAIVAAGSGDFGAGEWLKLTGLGSPHLAAQIVPLRCEEATGASPPPAVLVMIYDLEGHVEMDTKVLRELFGITRAEARLASAIRRGDSLHQAANDLGISINTSRAQLRSIFAKTGLRRQQELVHLLTVLSMFTPLHA